MKELEAELSAMPGFKEPEKSFSENRTDPEYGYIHQTRKKRFGYLTEMTVDTDYGIITGINCYPGNQRESNIILEFLKGQFCKYQNNAMKKGFRYKKGKDRFVCMEGEYIEFQKLIYKKATQNYYRLYSRSKNQCQKCP